MRSDASTTAPQLGHLAGPYRSDLRVPKCHNLALLHSAPFGTWHFGTQLRLALGTLALSSVWHLALWHSRTEWHLALGTWHSRRSGTPVHPIPLVAPAILAVPVGVTEGGAGSPL